MPKSAAHLCLSLGWIKRLDPAQYFQTSKYAGYVAVPKPAAHLCLSLGTVWDGSRDWVLNSILPDQYVYKIGSCAHLCLIFGIVPEMGPVLINTPQTGIKSTLCPPLPHLWNSSGWIQRLGPDQ